MYASTLWVQSVPVPDCVTAQPLNYLKTFHKLQFFVTLLQSPHFLRLVSVCSQGLRAKHKLFILVETFSTQHGCVFTSVHDAQGKPVSIGVHSRHVCIDCICNCTASKVVPEQVMGYLEILSQRQPDLT